LQTCLTARNVSPITVYTLYSHLTQFVATSFIQETKTSVTGKLLFSSWRVHV